MSHLVSGSLPAGEDEGDPDPRWFDRLVPGHQLGDASWTANADGQPVVARAVKAAGFEPGAAAPGAPEQLVELASVRADQLVPLLGAAERDGSLWLVSGHVQGVSLARLLAAATLTPVQATYVATEVLRGVAALHAAGLAHGRLTGSNVVIDVDGQPRLADWAPHALVPPHDVDDVFAQDLDHARALVKNLAANADRPVIHHDGRYDGLMAALAATAHAPDDEPAEATARGLEAALLEYLGDDTSTAGTRAEIGAVITTLTRRSSPRERPAAVRRSEPIPVPGLLPSGRLSEANWRRAGRLRWWRRVAVALAVAALVGTVFVLARGPVADAVDRIVGRDDSPGDTSQVAPTDSPSPDADPTAPLDPTPEPVPELAPPQSGDVLSVTLTPVATCAAGSDCLLRATARITPSSEFRQVDVVIRVVDRCTGVVRAAGSRSVSAEPGWSSVFVTIQSRLPRSDALGVVALTTAPDRAASPPLLLPPSGASC